MRGKIKYRNFQNQVRDYTKMRWGNITPTDIDGFLDFQNKLFIFLELKYGDAPISYGQKLALERLTDASRVPAYAIIAKHEDEGDIQVHDALVLKFRHNGCWYEGNGKLKPFVDSLIEKYLV